MHLIRHQSATSSRIHGSVSSVGTWQRVETARVPNVFLMNHDYGKSSDVSGFCIGDVAITLLKFCIDIETNRL